MGTIIVDNENIKKHFENIIFNQDSSEIRKIVIASKSGKGKTSLIEYLKEQCQPHNIPAICFDFKFNELVSELDLIDHIIYYLKDIYDCINFEEYDNYISEYYEKGNSNIIIKKVKIIQSKVGNITTPEHIAPHFITKATSAFWRDFDNMLSNKKIFLIFDSYEVAPDEIRKWIDRFILQKNLSKNRLFIILATIENKFFFNSMLSHDIQQYFLPDYYELQDWYRFGEEIHIPDTSIIDKYFNYYHGEPFKMCIALKPLGDFHEC